MLLAIGHIERPGIRCPDLAINSFTSVCAVPWYLNEELAEHEGTPQSWGNCTTTP